MVRRRAALNVLLALVAASAGLRADPVQAAVPWLWDFHWQITAIPMAHGPFHAAYSGPDSLSDRTEFDTSLTSTLYVGTRLLPGLEFYADPQLYGGGGFSGTLGVAGFPNGEDYRISNPNLHGGLSQAFVQWVIGLGGPTEAIDEGQNQIAGNRPVSRLTLVAGEISLSGYFDDNAYSHDARNQFFNWALMDMGAWDYAADLNGYTDALYLEWNGPFWTARYAEAGMPTKPNGPDLSPDVRRNRSENAEWDLRWTLACGQGASRWLGYWNHADMGDYRATLDTPSDLMDVNLSASAGAEKYGFGWSFDQALGPAAGVFSRISWSPGDEETFAYTAIDRSACLGFQFNGCSWRRPSDRAGLAAVINGLNPAHAEYLAAGGDDFIIGDGGLDYGLEQIAEAYYDCSPLGGFSVTPDFQFIKNPGYNQVRGPVEVYGLRFHYEI